MSDVNKGVRELIASHGFAQVVAALARYAHSPSRQENIPPRNFAVAFRRLNALFGYLLGASK